MAELALRRVRARGGADVWTHRGGLGGLEAHLREQSTHRIVVVGSESRLAASGLREQLPPVDVETFSGFTPNPSIRDVRRAIACVADCAPDVVIGIGGGSALDTAKLARAVVEVAPATFRPRPLRLILIPTLAGSGSEVTRFATFYKGRTKNSVDDPRLLPDLVIADPALVSGTACEVAASSALDAVSQCVESLWARESTAWSRHSAEAGLRTLARVLPFTEPRVDDASAELLVRASLHGGHAIDVSRTTAAHAFAYPTTAMFGVRHGLAAALHLIWLVPYVLDALDDACSDSRGADFVRGNLDLAADALGIVGSGALARALEQLVAGCGLATRLGAYGVRESDLDDLIRDALATPRAGNLPVSIDPVEARRRLEDRL